MTRVIEHCHNRGHGALLSQGPCSIVMTSVRGHCDVRGMEMEHCDERCHGAL